MTITGTFSSRSIAAVAAPRVRTTLLSGRSRRVTGPYVDKAGNPMTEGGGSLVIEATTPTWRGPGHPGFLRDAGNVYMVFHAYFGEGRGRGSALQVSTVVWDDGWPRVGVLR
jgi:arabinan endo-1,5-alpha-L-arabinosidase